MPFISYGVYVFPRFAIFFFILHCILHFSCKILHFECIYKVSDILKIMWLFIYKLLCLGVPLLLFYLFIFLSQPSYFYFFYFFFKLYNIVLVLPNIEMNPPQVYMYSPSWTLLPSHTIPLGHPSAPAPSIQYCASNLDWWLISYMILYMFQCHSPKSSHPLPLPQSPQDCSIYHVSFAVSYTGLLLPYF